MSKYHEAILKGYDGRLGCWKACSNWSEGLILDQFYYNDKPLDIHFSLQGTCLGSSIENWRWTPSIEQGCLVGFLYGSQESDLYKARFSIGVVSKGICFSLEQQSSQDDQMGWHLEGPFSLDLNTISLNQSLNGPLQLGLIKNKYPLWLTSGQLAIKEEKKLMSLKRPQAQVTLIIGGGADD